MTEIIIHAITVRCDVLQLYISNNDLIKISFKASVMR